MQFIKFFLFLIFVKSVYCKYVVPLAKVEILDPKGFQVSIPDEEGISLFAFHGKLNEEFDGLEAGEWARDIVVAKNGRWTFKDKLQRFKVGDVLYFWTYVIYNGLGYSQYDGVHVVKGFINVKTCVKSVTQVNGMNPCVGDLIFEENFNENSLNSSKWKIEHKFSSEPDYEFAVYENNNDVLKFSNGLAKINPLLLEDVYGIQDFVTTGSKDLGSKCTSEFGSDDCVRTRNRQSVLPPIVSGRFNTKNKFNFIYGKVEISARVPCGHWIYPELYLESVSKPYGSSNQKMVTLADESNNLLSGQMVIAQVSGGPKKLKELQGGAMLSDLEPFRSSKLCKKVTTSQDWCQDFHTYSLEWKTGE